MELAHADDQQQRHRAEDFAQAGTGHERSSGRAR